MGRAYSGLVVGAILATLFSGNGIVIARKVVQRIPPTAVIALLVAGFVLVDVNEAYVFGFSWLVALIIASLLLNRSWLTRFLELPLLVWFGKRSYAMYLIQGFGIELIELLLKPKNVFYEVVIAMSAFAITSLGAAILHQIIEEPARRYGKKIVASRNERKFLQSDVRVPLTD
jgi:peptidoglycan/LPS O-acetylase OafA/YrhL